MPWRMLCRGVGVGEGEGEGEWSSQWYSPFEVPVYLMAKVCSGLLAGWAQAGWCFCFFLLLLFGQDLLLLRPVLLLNFSASLLLCFAWLGPWRSFARSFRQRRKVTQLGTGDTRSCSCSRSRRRGLQTFDTRSLGDWCVLRLDSR